MFGFVPNKALRRLVEKQAEMCNSGASQCDTQVYEKLKWKSLVDRYSVEIVLFLESMKNMI